MLALDGLDGAMTPPLKPVRLELNNGRSWYDAATGLPAWSAFAQLVAAVTRPPRQLSVGISADGEQTSTTTHSLLRLLDCNGPMTTCELRDAVGLLHTKQVWGMLKAARARGEVRHDDGLWELNREFPGTNVLQAAELLRSRGWKVQAPTS